MRIGLPECSPEVLILVLYLVFTILLSDTTLIKPLFHGLWVGGSQICKKVNHLQGIISNYDHRLIGA